MHLDKKYYIGLVMLTILSIAGLLYFGIQRKKVTTPIRTVAYEGPQIPVYSGTKLIKANKGVDKESFSYEATWESNMTIPEISSWYEKALTSSGWIVDILPANPKDTDVQLLVFRKDGLILNLSLIRDKNTSNTQIIAQFLPEPVGDEEEE